MKVIKADPNTFLLIDIEGFNAELVPVIAWRVCPLATRKPEPVPVPDEYQDCGYPIVFMDCGIISGAGDHIFRRFPLGLSVNDAELIASHWREANKE